jgi:putative addiction module antidote
MVKVEKEQKIRKIGNSQGIFLSKEILSFQGMGVNDKVTVTADENGIHIQPKKEIFEEAMKLAEIGIQKYHRTFRELAK